MSQIPSEHVAQHGWKQWLPAILVAVGFLPLIYWHIGGLLLRPHYQFLLLLPFTLWMLAAGAERVLLAPVSNREVVGSCMLLLPALAGLAFATWAWSPWIAAVSCMIAVFAVLLGLAGWRGIRQWFPVWIFCWVLIPLPFGIDEDLIVKLRGVTTRVSSSVLDQMGVLHNSYANVIELPGKPLFIADACSGIHSLYVLMAAALFLAMWLQRGVIHTVCLLASTFALVLVENVTRIVTVAATLRWQMDLSIGWKHEALGVVLFVLSLFFVFTTDQLLMFFLPSRIPSLLNRFYEWQIGEGEDRHERKRRKPPAATPAWQKTLLALTVVFPAVAIAQLARLPDDAPSLASALAEDFDLPEFGEDALPEQLAGFSRQSYETVARVPGDPLGQASQQWTFTRGDLSAMVSIDYPYDGIHDLTVCYSQIGWNISDAHVIPVAEMQAVDPAAGGAVAIGYLQRKLYGNGVLLFQLCDLEGHVDAVVKDKARGDVDQRAANRFQAFAEPEPKSNIGTLRGPPYVQTQILARTSRQITERDTSDLLKLFVAAQSLLRTRTLEQPLPQETE